MHWAKYEVPWIREHVPYAVEVLIVGVLILFAGVLQIACGCVWPRDRLSDNHRLRYVRLDELDVLYEFVTRHLGPELLDKREFQAMLQINAQICYLIESKTDDTKSDWTLVGCFCILPLKQGAVGELESGELTGLRLKPENLTRKKGTARGFYLGVVVATDIRTKGYAVWKIQEELSRLCKKHGTTKVFGRPITQDGLRLLKKHGFKRVPDLDEPQLNFVCVRIWKP